MFDRCSLAQFEDSEDFTSLVPDIIGEGGIRSGLRWFFRPMEYWTQ